MAQQRAQDKGVDDTIDELAWLHLSPAHGSATGELPEVATTVEATVIRQGALSSRPFHGFHCGVVDITHKVVLRWAPSKDPPDTAEPVDSGTPVSEGEG